MIALDMSMTPSCLNQYSDQFKQTLTGELEKAKQAILSSPDFCPGAHDVTLQQTSVNMMAMNVNVSLKTSPFIMQKHSPCRFDSKPMAAC